MPVNLLFLGSADADFGILSRRVRPGPDVLVKFVNMGRIYPPGHPKEGLPISVDELSGYKADVCIYSEHIGDAGEREAIFASVLNP